MRALWLLALIGCGAGPAIRLDPLQARAEGVDRLQVYVAGTSDPVFGETTREGDVLIFRPRFPFKPGTSYRVVAGDVEQTFLLPAPPPGPSTELLRLYPTSSVLPENQLKFYLQFSGPMSRGELYRRVQLFEGGRQVQRPFLELGEELWDRGAIRVTLLFDPGRIKSGLVPREEEGPALEAGKSYELVIDGGWPDAEGRPLREGHRKAFKVEGPDTTPPNASTWIWSKPRAGTTLPLILQFPEPLDAGLLARVLVVEGMEGRVEIDREETRWSYFPSKPWKAGPQTLVVETLLEDRAGNSLERPFEVDVIRPAEGRLQPKTLRLPFSVAE